MRHLLSRLRGYFIFNPLIWFYTVVLGTGSLISSLLDRDGRIQHGFARLWSWLIMKTIFSAAGTPAAIRRRPRLTPA